MLKRLWEMLASVGEDVEEPTQTVSIESEGADRELDTAFAGLRSVIPVVRMLTPLQPGIAMTQDEVIAWDMLRQHEFSRKRLEEEGLLAEYEALGVSPEAEARWLGEYMEELLDGFQVDALLMLIVEYADQPMMDRLLEALDAAVARAAVPAEAVARGYASILSALKLGVFDEAYTASALQRLLEIGRRWRAIRPGAEAIGGEAAP